MAPFMQHLSIAGTIGSLYGKYPRIIVALCGICNAISIIGLQINAISATISSCTDSIDPVIFTILTTLMLIVYATLGGIRSVTNTDVLQLITFTIIIALIAKLMFTKADQSTLEIASLLQKQEKFQLGSLFHSDRQLLNLLAYVPYCFFIIPDPSIIQRAYMCASPMQVKKVFLYGSFFHAALMLCTCLISLFVFAGNQALSLKEIWNYILADMPTFFKGSVVICILGMAMSTADSYLHICSVMVAYDLMESIRGIKSVSYRLQIRIAKLASLICGLLAIAIAIYTNHPFINFTDMVLHHISMLCHCIITPPFILAIFGFRGTSRTALIGMVICILTDLFCKN